MKKILLLSANLVFFIIFTLYSCKNQEEQIIKQERMAKILTDIHIAEAAVKNENNISLDSQKNLIKVYYKEIFEKYKIDKKLFDSSMTFYVNNPKEFETIYEQINENLSTKEGKGWENKK